MTKFRSKRLEDQHPLFAGDGAKLAFGKRWDGRLVSISEVESGATCGCYCPDPACGRPLWAKKGEELTHHFAHAPLSAEEKRRGVIPVCANGGKTGLHIFAQELLDREKHLTIPPFKVNIGDREKSITLAKDYQFDRAVLEKMDRENIPDVILYKSTQRLHVEILVTHRCDAEKISKLKIANISAIEINLSGLRQRQDSRALDLEALSIAILREEPREWLHNRHEQDLLDKLQAEIDKDAEAKADNRRRQSERMRREYQKALRRVMNDSPVGSREDEMLTPEQANCLDALAGGEGFFTVHPRLWRAETLNLLRDAASLHQIVQCLNGKGWLNSSFTPYRTDCGELLRDVGLSPASAEEAVSTFLQTLAKQHIAEEQGGAWYLTAAQRSIIASASRERDKIAREQEARRQRRADLDDVVQSIMQFASAADCVAFSLPSWRSTSIANLGAPAALAEIGGMNWDVLLADLQKTRTVLEGRRNPPADCLGLPVEERLASIHHARVEKLVEQRRSREEAERVTMTKRTAEFEICLGPFREEFSGWATEPNSALDGMSPRQAAENSPEHFYRAKTLLSQKIRRWVERKQRAEKLLNEAKRIFHDDEVARIAINTPGWGLPDNMKPVDYVTDDKTFSECIRILKSAPRKRR